MTTLEQEFLEPPASYRSRPFWAWNGKLDEKELLRQFAASMGDLDGESGKSIFGKKKR